MRVGVRTGVYRTLAALIALQFGAGCSMALIQRAPPPEKRRACFYCSQEMVLPAADGLVAALAFSNGIYALSKQDSDYAGKTLSQGADLAISALITLVFAISAGVGTGWILECRAASEAAAVPAAAVRNPLGPPKGATAPPAADEPIVAPVDPDPPGDDTPAVR